jgi:hypothetical protein
MENKKGTQQDNGNNTYNTDNQKGEFPGYPHYPGNEDITRVQNNNGKEQFNEENIALPNANDIPGQEHITPAPLGALADTTISSADEEDVLNGTSLDGDDDTKIVMGTDADVTAEDLRMLDAADQNMDTIDDENLQNAALDDVDEDGEQLNEDSLGNDVSGSDLDVPGSGEDDSDELIGEEDEENNYYSLGGDNHEAEEENNGDQ